MTETPSDCRFWIFDFRLPEKEIRNPSQDFSFMSFLVFSLITLSVRVSTS